MKAQARLRMSASSPVLARTTDRSARTVPMPHQGLMVGRYGKRAAHVPVVIGPAVAESLRRRGAAGASLDGVIFLPNERVGPDLVAHEIAHALQQMRGGADGLAAVNDIGTLIQRLAHAPVLPESAHAEAVARASQNTAEAPPQATQPALPPGVVSLRRIGAPATHDAAPEAPVPAQTVPETRAPETRAAGTSAPATETVAPQAGEGDIAPSFAPPEAVEPTLDPAIAAQRAAMADAAREALAAADSPETVMAAYGLMAPSQQAVIQPELGALLGEAATASNGKLGEATPEIKVESRGGDGPLPMPAPVAVPADAPDIELEAAADPTVVVPDAPAQPVLRVDPGYGTSIERRFSESATAERIEESVDAVSTSNPGIQTRVADRADVPLDGANDPQRLQETQDAQREQASQLRQQAARAVIDGPGPEQIVPRALEAGAPAPAFPGPQTAGLEPAPEAQQLQEMALPETVVASFDSASSAEMRASAEASRQEMQRAEQARDTAHGEAVTKAETDRQAAEASADISQRRAVADERRAIQDKRQETVDAQNQEMARVNGEASRAHRAKRAEAQRETEAGQQRIDDRYDQAERESEAEIRRGEEEAERERLRKKRESEDASWWERAVNFIKDAFNALVNLVNAIFDAVRTLVTELIDLARRAVTALIEAISAALQALVSALGDLLKVLVDGLIGQIFPELAQALNEAIDSAVSRVNSAIDSAAQLLVAGVNAIASALTSAVNALLDVFQGAINAALAVLQAAITGDWGALLLKVLDAVLSVLGIDPVAFHAMIAQASDAVSTIVNDPGRFVSNMIGVVVGGVQLFADHFGDHLRRGVIGWLTGALGNIEIPDEWTIWTVLDLARQILGLTWDFLRERAANLIGPENVARIEMMASWIGTLITEGWAGLWTRIQESLTSLRDSVLASIRDFVMERVVMAAITWLASLFNPVGALVKLVMTIWNIYQFVSGQLRRLFGIVQAVVGAISNVAMGVLEPGMRAVETVLGNLVPVVIDLLMSLLGVTGVAARVREIIQTLRQRIADAVDNMLRRVLTTLGGGRGRGGAAEASAGEPGQIGHPVLIDVAEGQDHTLSIDRAGAGGATVMLRSDPRPLGQWLDTLAGLAAQEADAAKKAIAETKIAEARALLNQLDPIADQAAATPAPAAGAARPAASTAPGAGANAAAERAGAIEDRLGPVLTLIFDTLGQPASAFTDRYRENIRAMHEQAQQKIGIDMRANAAALQVLPDWAAVSAALRQRSDLFTSPLQAELAYGRVARGWLRDRIPAEHAQSIDRILTVIFQKVRDDDAQFAALRNALQTNILTPGATVADALLTGAITLAIDTLGDTPDPRLAAALPSSDSIIPFMIAIAKGNKVQEIDEAELERLWTTTANSNLIKDRFRGVSPGQHEWIPTNYIINVIRRASEATRAGEELGEAAALWIDVQHAWRSPTDQLIYKPEADRTRRISVVRTDASGQTSTVQAVVLQGHSGAVYAGARSTGPVPGEAVPQVAGQGPWHDELRRMFNGGAAITESRAAIASIITNVETYARATIWQGQTTAEMQNFDEYFGSTSGGRLTLGALGARAAGAMANIASNFSAARGRIA